MMIMVKPKCVVVPTVLGNVVANGAKVVILTTAPQSHRLHSRFRSFILKWTFYFWNFMNERMK